MDSWQPTKVLTSALLLDRVTFIDWACRYPDVSASIPQIPMVCGAHSGRPSIFTMFIVLSAASMDGLSTYFVSTSAQFFLLSTLRSSIWRDRILSCIHRSVTSKWRMRPSPFLLAIPVAAVASEWATIPRRHPISRHNDWMPNACARPCAMPCSSASPELNEMVV